MSTPRHHTEWLGLIDQSGPFLSLPVLLRVFPQGLDMVDGDLRRGLAQAYAEWQASGEGGAPDPVLHQAWIRFVLEEVLDLPEAALLRDQSLPPALRLNRTEEGEVLRPDLALVAPAVGGVVEAPVEANPTPDLFGDAAPQAGAEAAAQATAQMSALPDSSSAAGQAPPGDLGTTADQAPRQSGRTRLLIQTWPVHQRLDRTVPGRFWKASPAARMADLLRAADVPLGLVTNGEDWLLIYAPRDVETASYATWHASLWREEPLTLRALVSLLGARRFFGVPPEDGLAALFAESAEHQQDVTEQLGAQVLAAVEILIQSIDRLDKERGRALLAGYSVTRLYEAGLTVMMRLVFLLFAEERFLLPADNPIYAQHYAVSTLGGQLREVADQQGEELLERRYDAWNRLLALFRLIYAGSEAQDLRLPAYGGHLFDPDAFPFLEGRPAGSRWLETPSVSSSSQPLAIHNRTVLHLLEALQTLELATPGGGPAQARRLSFRALTEENIGSVYEGLLDHTARRTPEPVLGLTAAGNGTVHLALAELETLREQGIDPLAAALKQQTKRSLAALRRAVTLPEEGAQANGQPDTANAADAREHSRLRTACDNDDALQARVLPFAALLRADSLGYPVVISAGSVFVSAGQDRRSSGTHYTPPELTEPMVRHALDPLVYAGLAEGVPPSRETLRPPAEILALKVCDLACGSGAFLVQACRYLADKLVAAWERLEAEHPGEVVIAPDGMLAGERPPAARSRRTPRSAAWWPAGWSLTAASTASTSTRWPSRWPSSPSGSPPCSATGPSPSSITPWWPATPCSASPASMSLRPSTSTAAASSASSPTPTPCSTPPPNAPSWPPSRTTAWTRSRARPCCSPTLRKMSARPACSRTWSPAPSSPPPHRSAPAPTTCSRPQPCWTLAPWNSRPPTGSTAAAHSTGRSPSRRSSSAASRTRPRQTKPNATPWERLPAATKP